MTGVTPCGQAHALRAEEKWGFGRALRGAAASACRGLTVPLWQLSGLRDVEAVK